MLRARNTHPCNEIIRLKKGKTSSKSTGRRERKSQLGDTPMIVKDAWPKETMEIMDNDLLGRAQQENQARPFSEKNMVRKWAKAKWGNR